MGNTQKVVYLQDGQMCVLRHDSWHILDDNHARIDATVHSIDWDPGDAEKGDYEHHMLKEIYEQPEALENAMRGRLSDEDASAHFGGLNLDARQLRRAERFIFTACGTSYHAALVGEHLFEETVLLFRYAEANPSMAAELPGSRVRAFWYSVSASSSRSSWW